MAPVTRKTGDEGGRAVLRYEAAADGNAPATPNWVVDSVDVSELAAMAAQPAMAGGGAAPDARSAAVMCNGWQSWSAAWEVLPGERVHRARIIGKLNIYTDRPGLPVGRRAVVSHFYTWLRDGDDYLVLVSRNAGGPPASFRVHRNGGADGHGRVDVILYAEGQHLEAGEILVDLRVFRARGFHEVRDALRDIFGDFDLFERLAFLGDPKDSRVRPGGYESWYKHYADIDEGLILSDLEGLSATPNLIRRLYLDRKKTTIFQVDDGWEAGIGDWSVNTARFPRGLAPVAAAVAERGMVPGLWFAPFIAARTAPIVSERPGWILRTTAGRPVTAGWMPNWGGDFYCLDLSIPEVLDYIEGFIRTAVDQWGFRFLKLDFLYAGLLPGARARGGAAWESYEAALKRITDLRRTRDGRPVAFLGCGAPLENSFRYLPLMRIGADTKEEWDPPLIKFLRHQGRPSAYVNMKDTIGRAALDGAVFLNDPDVVFCRTASMSLTETEKELVAVTAFLLASPVMFSDDAHAFDAEGAEGAFTARMAELMDAVAGMEFGATRLPASAAGHADDAYRVWSRDGSAEGVLNLSDRPVRADGAWNRGAAALLDRRLPDGSFAPHSASLFMAKR